MNLEHVAIWTNQLEVLRSFYVKYFDGISNEMYTNPAKGFTSHFISFESGARLEIMSKASIPKNLNDTVDVQHLGIIHLAFGVDTMKQVDEKLQQLREAGFPILSGPRKTGDGYYEFETLDPDNNRLEVSALFVETE